MEETTKNWPQRILGVILEPIKTFQEIAADPRGLIPIIIVLAINLILAVWMLPQVKEATAEALKQAPNMGPEQIKAALKWTGISTMIGAVVAPILIWLVQAALLALFNQISLGEAKFKQLFVVAFYAWIPAFIGGVIKSIMVGVMGLKKAMAISTSLALLLPRSTDSGFIYMLLSKIDIFNVWSLILLVLGGSLAMKKESKKVALYIFGIWLIYIIIVAFLGAKSGAAVKM